MHTSIEALEARIAPAAVLSMNDTVAKFTDVDGDDVVIKTTKGKFTNNSFTFNGNQLEVLDIKTGGFTGADITITATKSATNGGDGFVNIGMIDAFHVDLGKVTVDGDLGVIDCGSDTSVKTALKGLTVQSIGRYDLETGAPDHKSDIDGKLEKLTVKTDVKEVYLHVFDTETGNVNGKIGSIFIGGSLLGTAAMGNNGLIEGSGDIGNVTINGSIIGGNAAGSGGLFSQKQLGTVKIGGDLRGGTGMMAGDMSGFIKGSSGIKGVTIGGSIFGGDKADAGEIVSDGAIGPVTVNGSIFGGTDERTGAIISAGTLGAVKINGDLRGSLGVESGFIKGGTSITGVTIGGSLRGGDSLHSGHVTSGGAIGSVTVNGSIVGGTDTFSGGITTDGTLGSVLVKGSVIGNSAHPVTISAEGIVNPASPAKALAIKGVQINGTAERVDILAGHDIVGDAVNADVQIGTIKVGGDWIASNAVAGAKATNGKFGDGDDALIAATPYSKIAKITIGGMAYGTPDGIVNNDSFGFVAQKISALSVGGVNIAVSDATPNQSIKVGWTNDLYVDEV